MPKITASKINFLVEKFEMVQRQIYWSPNCDHPVFTPKITPTFLLGDSNKHVDNILMGTMDSTIASDVIRGYKSHAIPFVILLSDLTYSHVRDVHNIGELYNLEIRVDFTDIIDKAQSFNTNVKTFHYSCISCYCCFSVARWF
uniref:Uncharacterized protein n=1 Tax=Cacopsylla melanoneura TaxID=428564 RepID=A0A8D8LI91_9HEMI